MLTLEKSAVADFEEDHALIAVRKLDSFLNKFCTPLAKAGGPLPPDFALKAHIRRCTRSVAVDGAYERRALKLAVEELFPNIVLLLRDFCKCPQDSVPGSITFRRPLLGGVDRVIR